MTAVAVKDASNQFREQMSKMDSEFAAALPPHIPLERFIRVVMTAVNADPDLLLADRRSLFASAVKAAQDGLLPDGREGAFVVYKTKVKGDRGQFEWIAKVQWMPMIAGILKRVRNSGELLSLNAHVVYEHDEFAYVLGDEERIEHRPALSNRGQPRAVYAIAKTSDGGVYREVMTYEEVEQVRAVSRAKESGPWVNWWGEMARKTVIRRLAKRLPTSADLDDLIRRDDELYDFSGQSQQSKVAVGLKDRLLQSKGTGGFSIEHVERETGEVIEQTVDTTEKEKVPVEATADADADDDTFPGDRP